MHFANEMSKYASICFLDASSRFLSRLPKLANIKDTKYANIKHAKLANIKYAKLTNDSSLGAKASLSPSSRI
jgi:hypothetical protein